jgi:FkbM family methyltransferase
MSVLSKVQSVVRLAPAFGNAIGAGLRSARLTYADVGARGGLPSPWYFAHKLGLVYPIFFEPDPVAAKVLGSSYPSTVVVPYALGAIDCKEETLYITRALGQTSVLKPDISNRFVNSDWDVVAERRIIVRRFDAIWQENWGPPAFVKIDVQGYELDVIAGIGNLMPQVLCLELECTFIPFYVGQPVFQDVHEILRAQDFDLVKLRPIGLYNAAVLIEFNAFFVRSGCHHDPRVKMWKAINDVPNEARVFAYGY